MAPKMMTDADGDLPPCSVMYDLEHAKRWDKMKEEKYRGKQKAPSMVERYNKRKVKDRNDTLHKEKVSEPPPKTSWWKRFFSCF